MKNSLNSNYDILNKYIEDYCKEHEISKREFVKEIGISRRHYFDIKEKKVPITSYMIKRFSDFLGIPYSLLSNQVLYDTEDTSVFSEVIELLLDLDDRQLENVKEYILDNQK
ncbi:helix-turn-helix domain-containing protein [Lactobacillus intestinalis]|uniref:helix-turn-helix domain-containing protein n=1 Tax=Lactobacillus intestinalis TaxID=151781 RepID=UPI0025A219F7|nr:helix-turn-helix transcriptional regulator [Lactobacillus intestinalis]